MNLIAAVFRTGVQNNSTNPPSLDQRYSLRIVTAKTYDEALEIIVKEEIHTSNAEYETRLEYQQMVSRKMTYYNSHLILQVAFSVYWKDLLKIVSFVIKKDETVY